jgi:hypothetical protein
MCSKAMGHALLRFWSFLRRPAVVILASTSSSSSKLRWKLGLLRDAWRRESQRQKKDTAVNVAIEPKTTMAARLPAVRPRLMPISGVFFGSGGEAVPLVLLRSKSWWYAMLS